MSNIPFSWKREATSEQTPITRLEFLASVNAELARLVAINKKSSLYLLEKIFQTKIINHCDRIAIREAIAKHL